MCVVKARGWVRRVVAECSASTGCSSSLSYVAATFIRELPSTGPGSGVRLGLPFEGTFESGSIASELRELSAMVILALDVDGVLLDSNRGGAGHWSGESSYVIA
jgi:hypothetical protein